MQSLQDDFLVRAVSLKFDEIMTSEVKKQYDGFIQYWSNSMKCIVISYCGSLFVDYCPSETLVEHFFEFINYLDINYILHIGMDGPNVNLKFQKLLVNADVLTNINKLFLEIGTCPLHVHNSFRKGVAALNFGADQYALDIHFFFKLSAGRRADYKSIGDVTNIVSEYAMKHSTTRWGTLRKVVVRLIEQHENLKEYF